MNPLFFKCLHIPVDIYACKEKKRTQNRWANGEIHGLYEILCRVFLKASSNQTYFSKGAQ